MACLPITTLVMKKYDGEKIITLDSKNDLTCPSYHTSNRCGDLAHKIFNVTDMCFCV